VVRFQNLICDDETRRAQLLKDPGLNGIDYIEVSAESLETQRFLHVYFIKPIDSLSFDSDPKNFSIIGGVRIRNIEVKDVKVMGNHAEVEVNQPGDFSTYTLIIKSEALDPAYAQCDFSFKAGCPSRFDCKPGLICPPELRVEPSIDYYAKDYASFRQALLDLIPTLVPEWTERHEADLGIALVELLAYVGDHLSYYQDAVANEAYLETARQRISVRRHAKLVDYNMHDGASARTFVHLSVKKPEFLPYEMRTLPAKTMVLSRIDVPLETKMPPHGPVITKDLEVVALEAADIVFETVNDAHLDHHLNEIKIHDWSNMRCCQPQGTTTVDLVGDLAADKSDLPNTWKLKSGDFLLFEEIKGVNTGLTEDADPSHRQVVRLTNVEKISDPLEKIDLTRVSWDTADALTFPLCVSAKLNAGKRKGEFEPKISVARGNLVLADHGRKVTEWHPSDPTGPEAKGIRIGQRAFRFRLSQGPLSNRISLPEGNGTLAPARAFFLTDPHKTEPQVTGLKVVTSTGEVDWKQSPVSDLLESAPFDRHFVVERDNDGRGVLRFGDGNYGMKPPDNANIEVAYRIGIGRVGNVGAESLVHLIKQDPLPQGNLWPEIEAAAQDLPRPIRNPISAWGGTDPQPIEEVKLQAPAAFHSEQLRAVTEDDYARAAEKLPEVSKAVATFRWTGSWHTVFLTIDPTGRTDFTMDLEKKVRSWVTSHTQAGYDLEIDPPTFVPLVIEIDVCVKPDHFRAHVEEALAVTLSNLKLPYGRLGFFHPDKFTFGEPLYLRRLYAALEAVEGVDSAEARRFIRQDEVDPEPGRPATKFNLNRGYIAAGRLEVIRLDNDPSFPENGQLKLNMLGGK
jgi:hypothetical protein